MKTLIIFFLSMFMALNINNAYSKTWILVHKTTDEILSISNQDDAQLPDENYEKIIITDDYWELVSELSAPANMYKYKNGNFIKNIKKISDKEIAKEEAKTDRKAKKNNLRTKLEGLGLDNNDINILIGRE